MYMMMITMMITVDVDFALITPAHRQHDPSSEIALNKIHPDRRQ
jgi:hypothetical protein